MEIKVLGSTKPGYTISKQEALNFSGKSAGICYLPDTMEQLLQEEEEKTEKRVKRTLESGHHSVFAHVHYNLILENIPKILAMILNNEKAYNTSEKSGRYTKMKASKEEEEIYLKWINILEKEIMKEYPFMDKKHAIKLAQENARDFISLFTPATTMEYTVSFMQLNYIIHWFKNYIDQEPNTTFNQKLKPVLKEFVEKTSFAEVELLNCDLKGRKISLFAQRKRKEEFGENYCTNYKASFPELAQALRHRTISYEIIIPEKKEYYVPVLIKNTQLEDEWLNDMKTLEDNFPQGLLVEVNERGTCENFVLKCMERLCGAAQLEITMQTKETLEKYIKNTEKTNPEIHQYLLDYANGARCTWNGWKCNSPCIWGAKNALNRKI